MPEGYVDTNGVRLWYEQRGAPDGAPVLLVMGVGGSVVCWPAALVEGLVDAGHRVVLFDNRDIGLSTHVDFASTPYTLDDMAADAIGVLDAVGVEHAHFLGVSLGGMISQVVALRQPERVDSLTLISSTPGPDERLSPPSDEFMAFVTRADNPDEDAIEHFVAFCRVLSGSRFPFNEQYYRRIIAADNTRGTNPDSSQGVVPMSASSRIDELVTVRAPTLVVHGTEDPLFPFDHAEALATAIPGAVLVPWDGVGHEIPEPLVPELSRLVLGHVA